MAVMGVNHDTGTDAPTLTERAREYEPTGDPDHVAYASDYFWRCTCGASAGTFTGKATALRRGRAHSEHCDGDVVVSVHA